MRSCLSCHSLTAAIVVSPSGITMFGPLEFLRIEPVPPLAFSVLFLQADRRRSVLLPSAPLRHSRKPSETSARRAPNDSSRRIADPRFRASFAHRSDDVLLGADPDGVPGVVARVVAIEIVVVIG